MAQMHSPRGSYHTHTVRCQHAEGDVTDYAQAAAAAGLLRLGAADHTPLPDGRWAGVRMRLDELPAYEAAVHAARQAVPGIRVLQGMECDIDAAYLPWYRATFLERGYDYLIASVHFVTSGGAEVSAFGCSGDAAALRDYARRIGLAIDSGLFAFIAHPDNIVARDRQWNADAAAFATDICAAAAARKLPLELNSLGLRDDRGYPWRPFWEIAAQHGCCAVASSDAHQPRHAATGLDAMAALAEELGITLVDPFASEGRMATG
jgi:histidinol-phosphatase (PHP family)